MCPIIALRVTIHSHLPCCYIFLLFPVHPLLPGGLNTSEAYRIGSAFVAFGTTGFMIFRIPVSNNHIIIRTLKQLISPACTAGKQIVTKNPSCRSCLHHFQILLYHEAPVADGNTFPWRLLIFTKNLQGIHEFNQSYTTESLLVNWVGLLLSQTHFPGRLPACFRLWQEY